MQLSSSAKHKNCIVDGCTNAAYGKSYCHKHEKTKGVVAVITPDQRRNMHSDCCDAACVGGDRHEYGREYCSKCKKACCWHPFAMSR